MKTPWTRSKLIEQVVIATLWAILYYTSEGQAADSTRYFCVFMAVVSLVAAVHYTIKDN